VRVLVVDNGPIIAKGPARLLNQHSARFHVELARRCGSVTLAQALLDWGGTDSLADFDLARHPELRLAALPWHDAGAGARVASYLRALPRVLRLVRETEHLYVFLPGNLPMLFLTAARLLGRPYGVYLRGELGVRTRPLQAALAGSRFAFATSDALRDVAREAGARAETVSPMLDVALEDVQERREVRREPPFDVLFVGRVEARKGVPELIEAVGKLRARGLALRLHLAGGGPELEGIRAAAAAVPDVEFLGVVSERERLRALFQRADLFVLPTHTEGFPRVLYEAMSYGTPVLTTFVGGIPSLMRDGENCLRIEVKDAERLAATIDHALGAPELRLRISAGGVATMRRLLGERRRSHAEQVAEKLAA
jgi:glycosyltransferase involved in cell wall biosynthesis